MKYSHFKSRLDRYNNGVDCIIRSLRLQPFQDEKIVSLISHNGQIYFATEYHIVRIDVK